MEISLAQILSGIDNAIADFEATAPLATNENDRKILTAAASDLRGIRTRMEKELPEQLNAFHALMQNMQVDAEKMASEIAAQQAKLAEIVAASAAAAAAVPAVATPAVPEEAKVDLGLGAALRTDLLNKLFPEAKPAEAFDPGKDIWQDWK
ncbi:MAG: hypothetical protein U0792_10665 [Gemmataceae bacterium]